MPLKRKITKFTEYLIVCIVVFFCRLLPYNLRERLTIRMAFLLASIIKKKKQLIYKNLRFAFPEKSESWTSDIVTNNIKKMGKFVAEFIEITGFFKRDIDSLISTDHSRDDLMELSKNGGIVVLGHMGNWEWVGWTIARWLPGQIYAMAKKQSNPWTDRMIEKMRSRGGIQSVFTDKGIYHFKKILKDKKILCILADQDAGKHGEFFQFMNRPASTFMGPAMLARITGCKMYYSSSWHENGKFGFHLEEIKPPQIDPRKYPKEWDRQATQSWVQRLEDSISKHPDDYFWVHNRWKTQPSPLNKSTI